MMGSKGSSSQGTRSMFLGPMLKSLPKKGSSEVDASVWWKKCLICSKIVRSSCVCLSAKSSRILSGND